MWTVILFVLPLAIDSFAAAATVGAAGLSRRQRLRVTLIFTLFEGGMPLVGLALGAPLAHAIGHWTTYLAAAVLIGTGLWMLFADDDDDQARDVLGGRGLAVLGLGLAISVDELAIGFGLGLARLPVVGVLVAIAVQAFVAVQLGLALGSQVGERWRERAERIAAVALIAVAVLLVVL
jgi:putative Mn2+ efflux pump MntP